MSPNRSTIENTHKSKETEEFLDVIFYRPIGYVMALASKRIGVTPNGITIFSVFVGVIAGHLFYYNNLTINIFGIILLVWAEALDSADGQLARMTDRKSKYGRILDGFGSNLWFVSIYIHVCLRLMNEGYSYTIFILALICGICHSFQSAMADYYRNYYLYFVYGKDRSEVDKSENLQTEYRELRWRRNFTKKFLMRIYLNYTIQQEFLAAKSIRLLNYISMLDKEQVPEEVSLEFRKKNKKLIKYYNILTTNTRMIVLIIAILVGYLPLYFFFEATLLTLLLIYVIYKHETNCEAILFKTIIINSGDPCIKVQ